MPIAFDNPENRHLEIANALADLNSASKLALNVQTYDLLIHVYCTQFKDLGFNIVVVVFQLITNKSMYPSLKTCNLLLSSLVNANELQKSYVVFDIICRGVTPDEWGSRQAFELKEKMIKNGVKLSLITYSVLINGLMKLKRYNEANCVSDKMLVEGFVVNVIVYNTLIDGYCKMGNIKNALKARDTMVSNGFCKINQMDEAQQFLEEMLSRGLSINPGAFTSVIHGLSTNSRFDSALRSTREMLLRNLRPNFGLLTAVLVTSNALIHGLCDDGNMHKAVRILKEMLEASPQGTWRLALGALLHLVSPRLVTSMLISESTVGDAVSSFRNEAFELSRQKLQGLTVFFHSFLLAFRFRGADPVMPPKAWLVASLSYRRRLDLGVGLCQRKPPHKLASSPNLLLGSPPIDFQSRDPAKLAIKRNPGSGAYLSQSKLVLDILSPCGNTYFVSRESTI
ncbi:tetratricopeptide repeat (TPR)-like superfamily protein [Actinidia rufa]|uniref:Tetratricopeptide repeat (TPR)-like superfamily protein n=1 Tax=Actinidia rufa TaxID=165716 RepID=A0A7J0F9T8_9ERIC|nr:tetratricopeptide repeat (TPR)-like superfamily protein [Actinidia rufa]